MFGVGIFEILVILIVAVIALGPNKLPQAIIDMVKFFRAIKKTMLEAKDTFDKELQLSELKKEALKYKENLTSEVDKLTKDMELDKLREIKNDITKPLDSAKNELESEAKELQSTLNSLNSEVAYDSTNAMQKNAESSQNALDSNPNSSLESTKDSATQSVQNEPKTSVESIQSLSYKATNNAI